MSKRLTDRECLLRKFQQMTDREIEDVLDYVSLMERANHQQRQRDTPNNPKLAQGQLTEDELLVSLSNAYENRRALQVFEWESARRRAEVGVGSWVR